MPLSCRHPYYYIIISKCRDPSWSGSCHLHNKYRYPCTWYLFFYIWNIVEKLRWSVTSYLSQEHSAAGLMFCHDWYPRVSPAISWPLHPSGDSRSADLLSPEGYNGQDMAGEMIFLSCLCLAIVHPEMPTVRHFYWGCYFRNILYRGSSTFCWIMLSLCVV